MQYNTFNIVGIKKTTNETIVEVQVDSQQHEYFMLSQVDGDDQFDRTSQANKDSLLLKSGEIIHNMYSLDKLWYHNQAARRHRYPYEQENYDYQHVYRKLENDHALTSMTKLGDTVYALEKLGTKGHSFVNDEMYKWLIKDNGWSAPSCSYIATMLYAQTQANQCLSDLVTAPVGDQLSNYYSDEQQQSTGIFATSAMIGVQYNMVYEIPGSIKQDYTKNEIVANTFKTKNQYNAEWTMQLSGSNILANARNYLDIRSCGGTLWLKYKASENYIENNTPYTIHPKFCAQINVKHDRNNNVGSVATQVEVITRINRGVESPQHKTSLYSLNLNTTLIDKIFSENSVTFAEKSGQKYITDDSRLNALKKTIKNEIKNCIRNIAENIAPANAQLFSVTVNNQ